MTIRRDHHMLWCVLCLSWLFAMAGTVVAQPTMNSPVVSPDVQEDHSVIFRLQAPNATHVTIMGDFVTRAMPMVKDDQGVWSYKTGALKPGVYGYYFSLDKTRIPDPGNLLISSGATFLKSYVEIPGSPAEFWELKDVPHGALHEHLYQSANLHTTRRVMVYTPPQYDRSQKYPVIYLYHGSGDNETFWMRVGRANAIMDNLIAAGKAKPAIIVSAYGHTTLPPIPESRATSGELYEVSAIEGDLIQSIIPLIEREYSVGTTPNDRAIAGLSMGGYQAMTIGLNNPQTIGYVAGFSAGFRANQDLESNFKKLLADTDGAQKSLKWVWIGIGSEEMGGIGPNRRVHQFLSSKGIKNDFTVVRGGTHTWLTWRAFFRDFASRAFADR